jgi:hypothetical protein
MKTNTNHFRACMLCLCICATFNANAQQDVIYNITLNMK